MGEVEVVMKQGDVLLFVDSVLGDCLNLVYFGIEVVQGWGIVIVIVMGMKIELGKIVLVL